MLKVRLKGDAGKVLRILQKLGGLGAEVVFLVDDKQLVELVKEAVSEGVAVEILPQQPSAPAPAQLPAQATAPAQEQVAKPALEELAGADMELLKKYKARSKRTQKAKPKPEHRKEERKEPEKAEMPEQRVPAQRPAEEPPKEIPEYVPRQPAGTEPSDEDVPTFTELLKLKSEAFARKLID